MEELTAYEKMAYVKAEELEQELKNVKHRVYLLEVLYGTTPPPPDPDDTEDTPYVAPQPGEVLTTGQDALVPVYFDATTSSTTNTFPYLFFVSDANSTFIAKLNLNINIVSNPKTLTIELFVDDVLVDNYILNSPYIGSYTIPFANAHISQQIAHKIQYKIVPTGGTGCVYKIVSAKYEIVGSNVLILNMPKKHSIYYCGGIYYIAKCEQGYSNYLVQSKTGLNLNATYTQHISTATEQQFCHSYERIDNVWQPTYLGYIFRRGNASTFLVNFNEPSKQIVLSNTYGFDYLPNLNTTYGGSVIFTSNGIIYYYDVLPDYSSRVTRTVENSSSYYVNVTGVRLLFDNFNTYTQKAKLVATRSDGTNVFFSALTSYYKIELGFGALISANYANETGSIINVFIRSFNQIVKKVLTINPSTNRYELTSEITIGTWKEYIEGFPPAYFTVNSNDELTYHP